MHFVLLVIGCFFWMKLSVQEIIKPHISCLQQDTGSQRVTPLMCAALKGNRETVETLLGLEADPDILDSDGDPALFCAIESGDQVLTEMLAGMTTKGEADRGTLL